MEVFKNSLRKTGQKDAVTSMSGAENLPIGPPAQYGGSADTLNPEELFVASVNSCIMLVFSHFAKKKELDFCEYSSEAEGIVEKTKEGLRFTGISVKAEVVLNDENQAGKVEEIAQLAEKYCLVSNSVSCPVEYSVAWQLSEN